MAGGKVRKERPAEYPEGGISFQKSKGQHILKNPLLIDNIVQKAGIKATDVILEIGLGTGNLTTKLLQAGKSVIAVELHPRMLLQLQTRFQGTSMSNRLKVIQGDVLKCDLPYFDICVANIPYHISSPLTFKLLAHRPLFRCAVIMFQSEFAMRLIAQPGDTLYSRLSVNTQLLACVSHLLKVGRNNFRPPPKVDSFVVRIEPRRPLPAVSFKEWDGLVRICFNRKNKTVGAVFRQKTVLSLLEKNYKTLQALQLSQDTSSGDADMALDVAALGASFEDLIVDADDDKNDEDMEDADTKSLEFRNKVLDVLKQACVADKRSSKLSEADFMHLLALFNRAGIHFS